MQAAVLARAHLENGLREALAQKQFLLHYQAQVTDTGWINGAEVLVRWMAPRASPGVTRRIHSAGRRHRPHPAAGPVGAGNQPATISLTGANPHRLKLELTESLLVSDVEGIIAKMNLLKAQGTGYSSLSYLKRRPLDQLKIDQGFVRDMLQNPNDAAIAGMVVALGTSLKLAVIAEGVETHAQRDFLASQGYYTHQGYLFSHISNRIARLKNGSICYLI